MDEKKKEFQSYDRTMATLKNIHRPRSLYVHVHIFFLTFLIFNSFQYAAEKEAVITVPIGSVLDLNSPLGSMVHSCIEVAVSDFYLRNPNYTTRLKLHTKNAQTLFDANLAVVELLNQEQVRGVIGPQKCSSAQESLVAEICKQHHVPVISFSARNSPVSNTNNPYLVRTTPDSTVQARALASICQEFEWHEVAVLYEDTDDGNHFLSDINKALQEIEVRLSYMVSISNTDEDSFIAKELSKLPTKQTRVFIVHMSPSFGSRFFQLAKSLGVMSEGYAWIISDSLSNFMNEMDSITREAMDGVLGIRPYASTSSQDFKSFQERWRRSMILKNSSSTDLNVYGLWAYDAVTALAIAVEKIVTEKKSTSASNLGQALLDEVSRTRFEGLSGDFQIINGNLKLSAFEIFNVYGSGEKTIGFWTPDRGRTLRDLRPFDETNSNKEEFRKVIWPGDSATRPKSSAIPMSGVLRIGVPWKHGYTEFVSVSVDPVTMRTNATGFSIDIFYAAMDLMNNPFKYEFRYYNDTPNTTANYDNVLRQIPQEFDMVVGDTTIWAPRADYVDFTQPYSESGVVLVVKNSKPMDIWIFTKPLRWDLWLAILVSFILMGAVILKLEHTVSGKSDESTNVGRRRMTYLAPVAILAFPETNMVRNKWSLFVLLFWLFMAFILMQSYTANLAAILTVDQLKFAFSDNYYIGCQDGSFMDKFLTENLHISKSRLRSYASVEEYHEAMTKGSKHGGIDAIFDEIPYMKILIRTYNPQYKMVGPTYRTGGFGFAFPKGSSLVSPFSKAILDVVQGPNMTALERKHFGPGYSSQDPLSSVITQETSSLRLYDFAGLFLIVGSVTLFALFFSETSIGKKMMGKTVNFFNRFNNGARVHSTHTDQNNDAVVEGRSTQENHNSTEEGFEVNVIEQDGEDNNIHEANQRNDGVIDGAQADNSIEIRNN